MSITLLTLGAIAFIAGGYALGRAHSEWLHHRERQRLAKYQQAASHHPV